MAQTFKELIRLTEEEEVEILPKKDSELVEVGRNVEGSSCIKKFGPFKTDVAAKVPLWFAIYFRNEGHCTIINPAWLTKENLDTLLSQELLNKGFIPMPTVDYWTVATRILQWPQHTRNPYLVKQLVKDIWECRLEKLQELLNAFITEMQSDGKAGERPFKCLENMNIQNVTFMELCVVEDKEFPYNEPEVEWFRRLVKRARNYSVVL